KLEGDMAVNAVSYALEVGYRHIDTAQYYGNEHEVGQAIKKSTVPREDIFLTTKVWNDKVGYEDTLASFEESLEKLGTD
ncbi:aldo/keto reductase, partial [Streptococcus anginosus]